MAGKCSTTGLNPQPIHGFEANWSLVDFTSSPLLRALDSQAFLWILDHYHLSQPFRFFPMKTNSLHDQRPDAHHLWHPLEAPESGS